MVVLDTHTLVWWADDPRKLGHRARAAIDEADHLAVPSIVFWEVSLLTRMGKVDLGMPVHEWAAHIRTIPRIVVVALTPDVALLADTLDMHPDPADRFIVATAMHERAPLITKDTLLRRLPVVKTIW